MKKEFPAMWEWSKAKTQSFSHDWGGFRKEPLSFFPDLAIDPCTMAKKSLSPSDTVFRFDIPGSPRKAGTEAPHSSTDSPGSVFLRWVHPVCRPGGLSHLTVVLWRALSSSLEAAIGQGEGEGTA